jgi:acyl carrier protein
MTQEVLFDSLQTAIKDVLNNQKLVVEPTSKFVSDLGLESIDFLDLSSEIENTIGFELDFKEVVQYLKDSNQNTTSMKDVTVDHLINYILAKKTVN